VPIYFVQKGQGRTLAAHAAGTDAVAHSRTSPAARAAPRLQLAAPNAHPCSSPHGAAPPPLAAASKPYNHRSAPLSLPSGPAMSHASSTQQQIEGKLREEGWTEGRDGMRGSRGSGRRDPETPPTNSLTSYARATMGSRRDGFYQPPLASSARA
jgi:hypothetical protein